MFRDSQVLEKVSASRGKKAEKIPPEKIGKQMHAHDVERVLSNAFWAENIIQKQPLSMVYLNLSIRGLHYLLGGFPGGTYSISVRL